VQPLAAPAKGQIRQLPHISQPNEFLGIEIDCHALEFKFSGLEPVEPWIKVLYGSRAATNSPVDAAPANAPPTQWVRGNRTQAEEWFSQLP